MQHISEIKWYIFINLQQKNQTDVKRTKNSDNMPQVRKSEKDSTRNKKKTSDKPRFINRNA